MKALRFWMASMMLGTALLGLAGAADCTDDRMSHRERETQDSSRQQVDIHGRRLPVPAVGSVPSSRCFSIARFRSASRLATIVAIAAVNGTPRGHSQLNLLCHSR